MDPHHRRLYVRWCQSPRVELVVGENVDSSDRSFLIPREFLERRSRILREQIEQHDEAISLLDTAVHTIEEFLIWNFSKRPQIDDRLNFGEVVQLGIFSWTYQVSALGNQVTDMIRANLASGEWQLQAAVVDAIYKAAPTKSPLREVIKAALGQLPRSSIDGDEWERTFRNNPDLGWDYHKAGDKEWTRQDYLSGVCRFHNHDGIKRQEGLCDGCPYAEADCYPVWEEDFKQEQEQEVEQRAEQTPTAEEQTAEAAVEETQTSEAEELVSEEVNCTEMNGHVELKVPEQPDSETNGTETPHVNGVNGVNGVGGVSGVNGINGIKGAAAADEVQSESMYGEDLPPESLPSDREGFAVHKEDGNGTEEKNPEAVTVTPVLEPETPKVSPKKNKKKKRMSISQPN